jgi:hypothetical protein
MNGNPGIGEQQRSMVVALARELDLPVEQVTRVYEQEAASIDATARIRTFVPVLVASRVRARLRDPAAVRSGRVNERR